VRKRRWGSRKVFEREIHPDIKQAFRNVLMPNFEEVTLKDYLKQIRLFIFKHTRQLIILTEHVKAMAEKQGIIVSDFAVKHGKQKADRRCSTCLGKYKVHYPYFKVSSPFEKPVKTEELKDFLRELEINEVWIERFIQLRDIRHELLKLYNNTREFLAECGLKIIEEMEEEVVESEADFSVGETSA